MNKIDKQFNSFNKGRFKQALGCRQKKQMGDRNNTLVFFGERKGLYYFFDVVK